MFLSVLVLEMFSVPGKSRFSVFASRFGDSHLFCGGNLLTELRRVVDFSLFAILVRTGVKT